MLYSLTYSRTTGYFHFVILRIIVPYAFFFGSLFILALNSPIKIYSLIHANKKLYYIDIAKYAVETTKSQWNIFTTYFTCKFYKTNKFLIWIRFYYKKCLLLNSIRATGINETHILYVSVTQSIMTVTWVALFNASLETVEWRWLSQIFRD